MNMSNRNNGILHYLKSFYRFTDSFNNAQAGFVSLADAHSGLLAHVNKCKTKRLGDLQKDVNNQINAVNGTNINTQARANAEKELTRRQNVLKQEELKYETLIQSLTPIITAIQQQVKTNSAGAAMLPQIGEAVLAILSKAVELASSIRV